MVGVVFVDDVVEYCRGLALIYESEAFGYVLKRNGSEGKRKLVTSASTTPVFGSSMTGLRPKGLRDMKGSCFCSAVVCTTDL